MGFVVIGLQIPVLRQVDFPSAWRSYRLVIAGVMATVVLASHPAWVTSVLEPHVYDSAEFTYDASADVAIARSVVAAEMTVPAGQLENAVLPSAQIAGYVYDSSASFVAPSTGGQRIALGLGDDLDDFASAQGAITYRDFPGDTGRFADDFYEFAGNPSNDVLFNLDGVRNPWSSVQRAGDLTLDEAMRAGASITDWELAQVYRNNWTHVQFFENGVLVPSPFG